MVGERGVGMLEGILSEALPGRHASEGGEGGAYQEHRAHRPAGDPAGEAAIQGAVRAVVLDGGDDRPQRRQAGEQAQERRVGEGDAPEERADPS